MECKQCENPNLKGIHTCEKKDYWTMKEGYYSPSIEEFHIGFEYEEASTMPSYLHWSKATWGKDPNAEFEFLYPGIKDGSIRVKYLDKVDVLDLGWVPFANKEDHVFDFFSDEDDYQIHTQFDNQFTQIYNWDSKIVFEGFVKNKSELKVLMGFLNIE